MSQAIELGQKASLTQRQNLRPCCWVHQDQSQSEQRVGQLATFQLMLKEMFLAQRTCYSASPSKGQNRPLCSEGDGKAPPPRCGQTRPEAPGCFRPVWDGWGQDRAPTAPLEQLFLFTAWASAACERDQASEACSSLRLTA